MGKLKTQLGLLGIILGLVASNGNAALDVELTQGVDGAVPIAIVPFEWQSGNAAPPADISQVISQDLSISGRFTLLDESAMSQKPHVALAVNRDFWHNKNVDYVVVGEVQPLSSGQYKVTFALVDVVAQDGEEPNPKGKKLITQSYTVDAKQLRHLAHHISDLIYEKVTGTQGVFHTRLAYILVKQQMTAEGRNKANYSLQVSDMDGHGSKPVIRSNEPILSPSWSPDGKNIAYVSFEGKRPGIYLSEISTGKRQLLTHYPGINGAPAWSPDGQKLAIALSNNGSPNIFILDVETKKLTRMTNDWSINTEPQWSPDGKSIIFTSDRGGSPQIYQLDLATKKVKRLTFIGKYNAKASFTPDGKQIVMLHRGENRQFNVALLDLETGALRELTHTGMDESPSVAPNGKMVVFATQYGGRGVLGMVSTDARIYLRLPDQQGNVQEPVWSPYL